MITKRELTTRMLRIALSVTGALLLLAGLFATPAAAQAYFSTMLNMSEYSEEALTWCGPAAGQMAMSGYPSGACLKSQDDIWTAILAHRTETVWDTDPSGLGGAMMSLCGGDWIVVANPGKAILMHSVATLMADFKYPVPTVLNTNAHNSYTPHKEHWVVIRGIVTDKDPRTNSTVTLEYVWFVDPSPAALGDPPIERYVSGAVWNAELQAVNKTGSTYNGQYVAVIEPPKSPGKVIFRERAIAGKILPPEQALRAAEQAIAHLKLGSLSPYRTLAESKPLTPVLVNPKSGAYYLIPYSSDGRTVKMTVLINAYSGEFEEIAAFSPRVMLSRQEVISNAARELQLKEAGAMTAVAIYDPEAGADQRYLPSWKIENEGKTIMLDKNGKLNHLVVPADQ